MRTDRGHPGPGADRRSEHEHSARRGSRFILEEAGAPVQVIAVGKKARDYFVKTRQDVIAEFIGIGDTTTLDMMRPIADIAIDDFASR